MREEAFRSVLRVRVDPARLEHHVRTLADLAPRDEIHPQKLDRAAAYTRHELHDAGGRVADHAFEANGATYRNVLAQFGPETRERIVVGAHYDAAGPHPRADAHARRVARLVQLQ